MIDVLRAIFFTCPWCHELPVGPYERLLDRGPLWMTIWTIRFDTWVPIWKLGQWWHFAQHLHIPRRVWTHQNSPNEPCADLTCEICTRLFPK